MEYCAKIHLHSAILIQCTLSLNSESNRYWISPFLLTLQVECLLLYANCNVHISASRVLVRIAQAHATIKRLWHVKEKIKMYSQMPDERGAWNENERTYMQIQKIRVEVEVPAQWVCDLSAFYLKRVTNWTIWSNLIYAPDFVEPFLAQRNHHAQFAINESEKGEKTEWKVTSERIFELTAPS